MDEQQRQVGLVRSRFTPGVNEVSFKTTPAFSFEQTFEAAAVCHKKGGDHISPSPGVVSCSPLNKSKYQSNVKNLNETEVISSFVKVGKSSF